MRTGSKEKGKKHKQCDKKNKDGAGWSKYNDRRLNWCINQLRFEVGFTKRLNKDVF